MGLSDCPGTSALRNIAVEQRREPEITDVTVDQVSQGENILISYSASILCLYNFAICIPEPVMSKHTFES